MRILIAATSYPEGPHDYRGLFVLEQRRALEERGHLVDLVTPGPWSLFHRDGVLDTLRTRPWLGVQLLPGMTALTAGLLRRARGNEVLLTHWLLPCGLLGATCRAAGGPPHLLVEHGGGLRLLETLPAPLRSLLLQVLASGTDRIQAVAPWIAARLAALCPALAERIDVDPMGVPPCPVPFPPPSLPLQVLFVGRLVPAKGASILLEALGLAPGIRLTVAGDGPERGALAAQARSLGDRVLLLGEVPPARLEPLLAEHHVLAVPSLPYPGGAEGTPTAALRAMTLGRVVVASRTGGLAGLVEDGVTGLLVPPGDPVALAAALRDLAARPGLLRQYGEAGRQQASRSFWPEAAARLEERLRILARR